MDFDSMDFDSMDFEYDVFVSHASEDKAAVVEPLVRALQERGLEVWYDRHQIRLGDDLLQKIEHGLSRSAFGVVVLSPSFQKFWPKAELGALINQEKVFGTKRILPVLLGLSHEEMTRTWPLLASRLAALGTEENIESVADQIHDAVRDPSAPPETSSPGSAKPRPERSGPRSRFPRLSAAALGIAAILLVAVGAWLWPPAALESPATGAAPLWPIFERIEAEGYAANRSLAGRYRPGDVLQIADPDPLETPILLLRSERCFPDLEPSVAPFPLPEEEASSEASFGLSGAQVMDLLPGLTIDDSVASSYQLAFDRPQIFTVSKLEISGRFSEECVLRLDEARAAGDDIAHFATVHEAVIAGGMTLQVQWKEGHVTAAQAAEVTRQAEDALRDASRSAPSIEVPGVRMEASNERRTVWKIDVPITLGYRFRPMQYHPPAPESAPASAPDESDGNASLREGPARPLRGTPLQGRLLAATFFAAGEDEAPREAFERGERFIGRLGVELKTEDGWRMVDPQRTFETGERFRFKIESSQAARVFVFHQPPEGKLAELWPAQRGDANLVEPGTSILVPPAAAFEMQEGTGTETFSIALMRPSRRVNKKLGNYVLRSLNRKGTRGVGIVDDVEPWLYFAKGSEDQLAAVDFHLRHAAPE